LNPSLATLASHQSRCRRLRTVALRGSLCEVNSLFNLKSLNELKKDQTKIKIFKNSSFDSSFNSVQGLNTNLAHLQIQSRCRRLRTDPENQQSSAILNLGLAKQAAGSKNKFRLPLSGHSEASPKAKTPLTQRGSYPKFSAILRAIRSIRLNKDEWKLIRFLNQMKKKFKLNLRIALPKATHWSTTSKAAKAAKAAKMATVPFESLSSSESSLQQRLLGSRNSKPPLDKKSKSKLKKELKKFARLLPLQPRLSKAGLETPHLNRETPSPALAGQRPNRLSLHQRVDGRTKKLNKVCTLQTTKNYPKPAQASAKGLKSNTLKQLIYKINDTPPAFWGEGSYNKIFSYKNIISKNILLRNMKFNFLKSTLSSILKKKIRLMSEILEDKPIKHYGIYSYLKFCIFSPTHSAKGVGGKTKLSLNKYKGRKLGSFIKYNQIIGYNFNSTTPFYQALSNCWAPFDSASKDSALFLPRLDSPAINQAKTKRDHSEALDRPKAIMRGELDLIRGGWSNLNSYIYKKFNNNKNGIASVAYEAGKGNIKDIYKLLFYLFKSMYCLISKPILNYTNDKITIQLFYYLNIPKKKVFRLFSISYINSIKKKWLTQPRAPLLPKGWNDGLYPTLPANAGSKRCEADKEANLKFTGGWAFLATLLKPKPEGTNKPLHQSPRRSDSCYLPKAGGRGNTKIYIR
jgi:hypothetical protein